MNYQEHRLQVSCVNWFRLQYPDHVLFAVPNGGARDRKTGAMLKREGVMAGVSDLILLHSSSGYHGLLIELKVGDGRQSQVQKIFEKRAKKNGYLYAIVRSFDEFRQLIEWYI